MVYNNAVVGHDSHTDSLRTLPFVDMSPAHRALSEGRRKTIFVNTSPKCFPAECLSLGASWCVVVWDEMIGPTNTLNIHKTKPISQRILVECAIALCSLFPLTELCIVHEEALLTPHKMTVRNVSAVRGCFLSLASVLHRIQRSCRV